jgi:hypothetical protein
MFAGQHGAQYTGPRLKRINCLTQPDDVPAVGLAISEAGGKHTSKDSILPENVQKGTGSDMSD